MGLLVDDLLNLARLGRTELRFQVAGLDSIVEDVIAGLKTESSGRQVEWKVGSLPFVECDPALIKQVMQNLLSNALKYTRPRACAIIEVNQKQENGEPVVFVRDNGVGFNMKYADKLFGVFQLRVRISACARLRSVISLIAAVMSIPPGPSKGLRLTSTGNSVPSFRRPYNSSPAPISRCLGD